MSIQNSVIIKPAPQYLGRDDAGFLFAYTIQIENHGDMAIRLLTRHWVITHGNGQVEEVKGDGVIGQQPTLKPGEQFSYRSGARLITGTGTMHGSYQFETSDGTKENVPIPEFALIAPQSLN